MKDWPELYPINGVEFGARKETYLAVEESLA